MVIMNAPTAVWAIGLPSYCLKTLVTKYVLSFETFHLEKNIPMPRHVPKPLYVQENKTGFGKCMIFFFPIIKTFLWKKLTHLWNSWNWMNIPSM